MSTAAQPVPSPRRARVEIVDVLKLLALLQMVNGHTLDAVMRAELRTGPIFDRYVYLRGLVSVAFMLAAGLAYHLTTFARFDAHRADLAARTKRVRRALWLIALGYLLHWPFGAFSDDPARVARSLAILARVDVLHCIGVSILALEAISTLCRDARRARLIAGALGLVLVALAPLGALAPAEGASAWWANWLTHAGGSLFPLTPWAAYVLLGAALGELLVPADPSRTRAEAPRRLALGAALALALGALLGALAPLLPSGIARSSEPGFFFEKLGAVLAILAAIGWGFRALPALPAPLRTLSGETLSIYAFHLIAIYWLPLGPFRTFGRTLDLLPALAVSATMIALSTAAGLAAPRARAFLGTLRGRMATAAVDRSPSLERPDVRAARS